MARAKLALWASVQAHRGDLDVAAAKWRRCLATWAHCGDQLKSCLLWAIWIPRAWHFEVDDTKAILRSWDWKHGGKISAVGIRDTPLPLNDPIKLS